MSVLRSNIILCDICCFRSASWSPVVLVVLSRSPMEVNCRRSDHCCSASHKGRCLGRYCRFCTLRNSNKWLHSMICVYISTPMIVAISDADITMARFTACVSDINAWMRASRLSPRLKPAKTQVIWLGSGQLLRQVSICHVPVLSTQVKPVSLLATSASL